MILWVRTLYFVRTAWSGIRTSPITSSIGAITIGISLLLLGAFALLVENMEGVLDKLGDELFVTAYLEERLSPEEEFDLEALARTVEGVESVRLVTKAEALDRFREGVGRGAALLEGLSTNPLPASLEITLVAARRSSVSGHIRKTSQCSAHRSLAAGEIPPK